MASILVVEDTADIRDVLIRQLHYAGHAVISAVNGIDGIACARAHLPDLIEMDLVMPRRNALDATKQLKADVRCADRRILAITARGRAETKEEGWAAGCAAIIS